MLSPSNLLTHIFALLEAMGCGAFFLDYDGRVRSLNASARDFLKDGLVLTRDHLSALDRDADKRLQEAIERSLSKPETTRTMMVAVPRPNKLPLIIRTIVLSQPTLQVSEAASLLLLALDPEQWSNPSYELLFQAFGLTQTEAEVAIGMAAGRTLLKIAKDRGIRIGTVRAHLKTIFSKTQTRGQADLTRVLTRLAFLVPRSRRDSSDHLLSDQSIDHDALRSEVACK